MVTEKIANVSSQDDQNDNKELNDIEPCNVKSGRNVTEQRRTIGCEMYHAVLTPEDECAKHGKSMGRSTSFYPGHLVCVDCVIASCEDSKIINAKLLQALLSARSHLSAGPEGISMALNAIDNALR